VLEAFSCGAPCLLSKGGSLPEVGGDAAIYFDPEDSDSIKSAVESILSNDNLKQELIKKGGERLLEFSWRKTYDKTLRFYGSIL
jgi:glycosyltransferase involved in cell wall biosynthesis